jgi:putative salt-induced outer membrane protein YdiY
MPIPLIFLLPVFFVLMLNACTHQLAYEADQQDITLATDKEAAGWLPAPPMPSKHDWLQLTSGEWLKGELITMYGDKVEFDSDKLGMLNINADDIYELRTHSRKSLRFNDGSVIEGKVYIRENRINLIGSGMRIYNRNKLISIGYARAYGELALWAGEISAGANLRDGNTKQNDFNLAVEAKRRTASNRLQLKYQGNYTEIDNKETENNQRFTSQYDVYFSNRAFFRPASLEVFRDTFQNIERRVTYSIGGGYTLMDHDLASWDISAGIGYQATKFSAVETGDNRNKTTPVLEFGTDYERDLTDDLSFDFIYNGQLVNSDSGQYNHRLETGLSMDILSDIDFKVRFIWDRIAKPTPDESGDTPKSDDTRVIFGLGYDF